MLDSGKPSGANGCTGAARWRVDVDQNLGVTNADKCAQSFFGLTFDCRRNIWIVRREGELDFDLAIIDLDVLDQTERNDVATESGISDTAERVPNLFF